MKAAGFPPLLLRSLRLDPGPDHLAELRTLAAAARDWDALIDQAEWHGLAPLLRHALSVADAPIPPVASERLMRLAVGHRRANDVRLLVLADILERLDANGIPVAVLKGPALCGSVYVRRSLRPMRDLDLLVPSIDADRAQSVLRRQGFEPADLVDGRSTPPLQHHLPMLVREASGMPVYVEIHRQVFNEHCAAHLELRRCGSRLSLRGGEHAWNAQGFHLDTTDGLVPFDVHGRSALALAPTWMLWHLCHHLVELFLPIRLLVAADIVNATVRLETAIDWELLRDRLPFVMSTLALIGLLVPWPDEVAHRLGVRSPATPSAIGVDYRGWPRVHPASPLRDPRAWLSLVEPTLRPPDWWLRLYHGAGLQAGVRGRLLLRHAALIGRLAFDRAALRVRS